MRYLNCIGKRGNVRKRLPEHEEAEVGAVRVREHNILPVRLLMIKMFSLLQLNPKERSVVIIENLMSPRALIDSIAHVLLRSY